MPRRLKKLKSKFKRDDRKPLKELPNVLLGKEPFRMPEKPKDEKGRARGLSEETHDFLNKSQANRSRGRKNARKAKAKREKQRRRAKGDAFLSAMVR